MGLGRLIVIGVVAWLCFRWWQQRRARAADKSRAQEGGRMVSCETCGVFVPEGDAHRASGKAWRCSQHRHGGAG